ncbi:MAG: CvpA family protein [Candidatus Omnitrophica bacterium]|nr:CvpA family protein [Candidatus Omnitrophota bacterium]MCF7877247.1 CvpA family protein [Candidatus Omnitrophota bacterium]MCF7893317.1 CvpA family protein [Candidatus Omnitrophota bacterium]
MDIAGKPGIIDIFFLILFLRVVYIAASRGALREACRVTGMISAAFFAFHFYPSLADLVQAKVSFINPNYLYAVSFFLIFAVIGLVFSLLNLIISLFLPKAESSAKKRIVLLAAGIFRGFFLLSTIFFFLNLVSFNPGYIKSSLSYNLSKKFAPQLYLISAKIISEFNKGFKINQKVENYLKENKSSKQGSIRI